MVDDTKGGRPDDVDAKDDAELVKEVDVTVPKTDDPSLPLLTFRMWLLGIISCVLLSFVNQFFWYRKNMFAVSSIAAQIAVLPIGHLMARTITKRVFLKGTWLEFTLNPGPFNIKEHVLITILANSGASSVYATHILSAVKLFYKRKLTLLPAFLIMLTTQTLGYGWAGIYRKYLVEPAEMWWPANLVQVSLFRALHEGKERIRGSISRSQFFLIVMICAAAYTVVSTYLFMALAAISVLCLVAPKSVLLNQLGSGTSGLGLGAFTFDWATLEFIGSPLVSPWFASVNIIIGFGLYMYVLVPIVYWLNIYQAKTFPFYSSNFFTANGTSYDVFSIVNANFDFDEAAYKRIGHLNLSGLFIMTYGIGFATLTATVVHVAIFNGRDIWRRARGAFGGKKKMDIHTRLMSVYDPVPMWWFHVILVLSLALIFVMVFCYGDMLQFPWWAVLLAAAVALFYTLPIGIIVATTNQQPGLNIITEYIMGYLYPGRPVANMCFKVYGYISMQQALSFLGDFKLGHYMKIPPRSMFMAQVVGTIVSVIVYTGTAWFLMSDIPHMCDTKLLPPDSPWTCPMDRVFYDASVIWGLVGPQRIFGNLGPYSKLNWFFLGGAVAPVLVWIAGKMFPGQGWIKMINIPVMLTATALIPPGKPINYTGWFVLAFLFGRFIYKRYPEWWVKYNYVMAGGMDAGTAFMSIFIFVALQNTSFIGIDWWGNAGDGCPLASCPTAKGVVVDGCPVF